MPGFLLDASSTLNCAHLPGLAQPMAPNPRVKILGQPIVVQTTQYAVSGCALTGSPNPPCATAQFTSGATRLKSLGAPALLQDSSSTCVPTGAPLTCMAVQTRVKGA
ncbi:MAG TPA: hypothetical protein VGO05_02580 [Roseiarcus sp.]|jgi:hypothetical protein|nr:hypothetical protein [Roseiarcus sp.]